MTENIRLIFVEMSDSLLQQLFILYWFYAYIF